MFENNLGGLVWLLASGALFYLIMRKGGCGMHAGHSHEHEHGHGGDVGAEGEGHSGQTQRSERDPVCGMPVDPARAEGTRTSMGRTFYLCSKACLEKFDRDPAAYAHQAMSDSPRPEPRRHAGC